MKFGLDAQTIRQINDVLLAFPPVEKAVIYGSRAKGNYKEGSDIDLCLYGDMIDLTALNQIALALDDLYLPYSFDLSVYSLLANLELISHIDRRGIIFFDKRSFT